MNKVMSHSFLRLSVSLKNETTHQDTVSVSEQLMYRIPWFMFCIHYKFQPKNSAWTEHESIDKGMKHFNETAT